MTTTAFPNRYAGSCTRCHTWVEAGAGTWSRRDGCTHLAAADCDAARVATETAQAVTIAAIEETGGLVTEPGIYKLDGDFFKVKWNQMKTRLYAERIVVHTHGDHHSVVFQFERVMNRLRAADRLTADEARTFGMAFSTCINCGKDLTDRDGRSQLAGYGATCAKNNGWPYPSLKEARAHYAAAQQAVA